MFRARAKGETWALGGVEDGEGAFGFVGCVAGFGEEEDGEGARYECVWFISALAFVLMGGNLGRTALGDQGEIFHRERLG